MSDVKSVVIKGYKIVVTKVEEREMINNTEYKNTHKQDEKGEDIWGYVDAPDKIVRVEDTIFSQVVEDIDILRLVAAINNADWRH